jgi:hypothetical protein
MVFGLGFLLAIRWSNRTYQGALAFAWLIVCLAWGAGALGQPILVR